MIFCIQFLRLLITAVVLLYRSELHSASDSTIQRWSLRQSVMGIGRIYHISSFTNCCIDSTLLD